MNTVGRVVLWLTCTALVGLSMWFVQLGPAAGNYPAQVLGALAAVAAIGVTVWATLRAGLSSSHQVVRSGDAEAIGAGSRAVTGINGTPGGTRSVTDSGNARATDGGSAITGADAR